MRYISLSLACAISTIIFAHIPGAIATEGSSTNIEDTRKTTQLKKAHKHIKNTKTSVRKSEPYPKIGNDIKVFTDCDGQEPCQGIDDEKSGLSSSRKRKLNGSTNISSSGNNLGRSANIQCPLTPEIWELTPVPSAHNSNNLRRLSGSAYFAQGNAINIIGRILDSNCVPVTGAKVEITQVDALGHDVTHKERDKNFAGTGTAITDNLGRFSFFTVMPGPTNKRAPHIRFSVRHSDLPHFETEMFFADNFANHTDKVLHQHVKPGMVDLLLAKYIGYDTKNAIDLYEFSITLTGTINYKTY